MRMANRRFTRLTNAFSKKFASAKTSQMLPHGLSVRPLILPETQKAAGHPRAAGEANPLC